MLSLRFFLNAIGAVTLMLSTMLSAQELNASPSEKGVVYSVKPDYRLCLFPMCGGWFLTPVNQFATQLESEDEAYEHSLLLPSTLYVAHVNYRQLALTEKEIRELEASMAKGQALLRGVIVATLNDSKQISPTKTLKVSKAWTSANSREPYGPYLKISSSGIVCITTPCPYYNAALINTLFTATFDDLTLEKAELDREQTARAWQAIATEGLVVTGVKYPYQGMTGIGTGVSATKVFFSFPQR